MHREPCFARSSAAAARARRGARRACTRVSGSKAAVPAESKAARFAAAGFSSDGAARCENDSGSEAAESTSKQGCPPAVTASHSPAHARAGRGGACACEGAMAEPGANESRALTVQREHSAAVARVRRLRRRRGHEAEQNARPPGSDMHCGLVAAWRGSTAWEHEAEQKPRHDGELLSRARHRAGPAATTATERGEGTRRLLRACSGESSARTYHVRRGHPLCCGGFERVAATARRGYEVAAKPRSRPSRARTLALLRQQ